MIRNATLGTIATVVLLAAQQPASAQGRTQTTCIFPWCPNYVLIEQDASGAPRGRLQWNEMQMANKLTGATVAWVLLGHPDYEFRADSIVGTGSSVGPAVWAQFPVREITPTRYSLDDLNTNNDTYTYEVRVYKKGAPPPAVVLPGTIVNSNK